MRRESLSSSAILSVGWEPNGTGDAEGVLEVEFAGGTVYRYEGVPRSELEGLKTAGSAGRYFRENIRDRYPARRA